ncbi:MAG TPA: DUF1385 domain-containing protein [Gaiellaceae bacterium]|nr:DUF1385 domain-containing protein [Gaiellaceae bacterium]
MGTLELLARADSTAALPRLGGMARPNGVVIVSERFWAFAGTDGSLREGTMFQPPEICHRIPLARGLVRLAASLGPLFRRAGVARPRERWMLLGAVIAPAGLAFVPAPWSTIAGIAIVVGLLLTILRGRTLRLHGAEHRAIAACEERTLVATWEGRAKPTRFSPRCGTNFAALAFPVTLLANRTPLPVAFWTPFVVLVLSLALTMEVWRLVQARGWRLLLVPGLALQRVTTREPRIEDTQVAMRAVARVLARELA